MLNRDIDKTGFVAFVALLISLVSIHYFVERADSVLLFLWFGVAFLAYFCFIARSYNHTSIFYMAIICRVVLLFGEPNLSDDVYRFLWDGSLLEAGIHPFSATPTQIVNSQLHIQGLNAELFNLLNSKDYFTIYPPISQFIFYLSSKIGGETIGGIAVLRIILLVFEIATMWLIRKMFPVSYSNQLAVYALNPLVIIELIANLHFEGIIVFFLLLAIWGLKNFKFGLSGFAVACAIAVKLVPLVYLPYIFRRIGLSNGSRFVTIIFLLLAFCCLPLYDHDLFQGMSDSLSLFFVHFEFNSAVFFAFRELGYSIFGYDAVATIGPLLSFVSLSLILSFSWTGLSKQKNYFQSFSIILFIQLIFSTTVHPWYIIPLIAFSLGSGYVFPIVWSALVLMSYLGYHESGYSHPLPFIFIEYAIVMLVAILEIMGVLKLKFLQHDEG